jgi:hypothetical protein
MSGPTFAQREVTTSEPNKIDLEKWALLSQGKNAPVRVALKELSRQQRIAADYLNKVPGAAEKYWGAYASSPQSAQPTQKAAQGGLMALRGYARGGTALTDKEVSFVEAAAKKMRNGEPLTTEEQTKLNSIETRTNKDVSPYTKTGTADPGNKSVLEAAQAIRTAYNDPNPNNPTSGKYVAPESKFANIIPEEYKNVPQGMANTFIESPYFDPTQMNTIYGGNTNIAGNMAIDKILAMERPEEYAQASDMYRTAGAGLQSLAGYTPQQVAAQNASAQRGAAQMAKASQMAKIAAVNAERAAAEKATASQMGPISDVAAREMQASYIQGAQMQRPEDVSAQEMQRYQMEGTAPVTTQALEAYQMAGPGSWTDAGVRDIYMNPYMQGVVDIAKREATTEYEKQQNELGAKAARAGAFGGARQALERSEAQRTYNQQLQDIQTRGLSDAYQSGMQQWTGETQMAQQAALQNLQSKLSTQSQSSQEAVQAMLSNQNIDYQTKVQNLQAMLGVQSQEAQQMLNASLANQQTGLATNQQNLSAEMQKQLANQQAGMTAQERNQQAALQAALANQQTAYGTGQFNAAALNQAALQNAQLGTQANLANQRAALEAALANQQTQFGVGSLNANLANQVALQNASLGTQASLTNAQLGTQANLANQRAALEAAMANQSAGLQGNQQNIAAYGAMGNMASGLGSIGSLNSAADQQKIQNLGAIRNTQEQQAKDYYSGLQKTGTATWGAPINAGPNAGKVVGPMTGTPGYSETNRSPG